MYRCSPLQLPRKGREQGYSEWRLKGINTWDVTTLFCIHYSIQPVNNHKFCSVCQVAYEGLLLIDFTEPHMVTLSWCSTQYKCKTKKRVFPSKQKPRPIYSILRGSVFVYLCSDCIFIHFVSSPTSRKTELLHHLCTNATLRVNKW